ncbi:MAG: cytochrome c [Chthoniobacteraceae bacterium]
MLRTFFVLFFLAVCGVLVLAGFRGSKSTQPPIQIFPDMDFQPKIHPQQPSTFFADGNSARELIAGTVPWGYTVEGRVLQAAARNASFGAGFANIPNYVDTGTMGNVYGDGIPLEVNEALLDRGQQRFDIYCSVCHGKTAAGNGIVQNIGNWATVANLQDDRIYNMPDGQIFSTITNGKNTMGAYGPVIAVEDRWAIVCYLRALQRSHRGALDDVPPEQQKLLKPASPAQPGAPVPAAPTAQPEAK